MDSLVVPANFVRATRDTGYRCLSTALAELIDNALDAGAKAVDVSIEEELMEGQRELTIAVLDDGAGMKAAELREALRFGGTKEFNDRTRSGRYGMGLPNASLSQARRLDVYSWSQEGAPLHAYLDVDEIVEGRQNSVPEPTERSLPAGFDNPPSTGTLVMWSRCDRLRFKKASTNERKVRHAIGRVYRKLLQDGLTIRVNGSGVAPVDPLFRIKRPGLVGACTSFREPIEYRIKSPRGTTSTVTIQFVELPVAKWHALPTAVKRREGIIGGAGISVLRGGREIDHGWHLFGGKRRENYDDWWRAELRFDPELDELFGITHSKQGINPTVQLREILEEDLEAIARELNRRARAAFGEARGQRAKPSVRVAKKKDPVLPALGHGNGTRRRGLAGFDYELRVVPNANGDFFRVQIQESRITILVNENHPFYRRVYRPAEQAGEGDFGVEILLLAAGRALAGTRSEETDRFLEQWSDNLAGFLRRR